jgi:hypothetical protein
MESCSSIVRSVPPLMRIDFIVGQAFLPVLLVADRKEMFCPTYRRFSISHLTFLIFHLLQRGSFNDK